VVDYQVLVGGAALRLAQVQLDRQHAAQRLDEVGVRLRSWAICSSSARRCGP